MERRDELREQQEQTAQVLATLAARGLPLRCPNWPEAGLEPDDNHIDGCGSTNLAGPDDEGLYDCRDCGIWFHPEVGPEEGSK